MDATPEARFEVQELYCGIDIGTSSTKAMVYDQALRLVFNISGQYNFALSRDQAELDPEDVYGAVDTCLRACINHATTKRQSLSFVAFSSALHSFIAVDATGRPLTNCITWADMRATEFNAVLKSSCNGQIYAKTGCPGNAIYMPAKIMWLQKYQPKIYDKAARYITIKEYVLHRLTGEWVADYGIASGGGLLNLKDLRWDQQILQFLGIAPAHFSTLVDGSTAISMTKASVENFGADIPLVVGSGDGPLANLGAGTYTSRQCVATIGTSGAIRVFSPKPIIDEHQRTWCYRLDAQTCVAGGAINNGGLVLKWLIKNCFQAETDIVRQKKSSIYQVLNDYVREIPAGSNGLLFLPFLTGERSPDWNSKARGVIIGLGMSHSRKDLVKAAMEGVVLRLYSNFLVLQELIGESQSVIVNGGFTRSRVWLQIMADIFGTELHLYENTGNSTLGAVFMGLKALGLIDRYDQVKVKLRLKETIRPDTSTAATYRDLYRLHEEAYERNKNLFEQLYQFRHEYDV